VLFSIFLSTPFPAAAQTRPEPAAQGAGLDEKSLLKSIENAVASETGSHEELKRQLERLEASQKMILAAISVHKARNSAYGNLLLFPDANSQELENAHGANKKALSSIHEKFEEINEQRATIEALRGQTRARIEIFGKQRGEIESGPWSESGKKSLLNALDRLQKITSEKDAVLKTLFEALTRTIQRLEDVRESTSLIAERLEKQLKSKFKQDLFGRRFLLLKAFSPGAVASELTGAGRKLGSLFSGEFWREADSRLRQGGEVPLFTLILFVVIGGFLISRTRRFCLHCETLPSVTNKRWRLLCLTLLRRSLFLTGAITVLFSYGVIQFHDVRMPFIRSVLN
ncbi:MAG: hypothetical protein GY859_21225, partial [Desulfobacterales bacterium]|nr:hypothetical protein [Desulfobacterales bacterium]